MARLHDLSTTTASVGGALFEPLPPEPHPSNPAPQFRPRQVRGRELGNAGEVVGGDQPDRPVPFLRPNAI